MPAKVDLTVTQGKLKGQQFHFEDRTICLVGRSSDCQLRLPDDAHHNTVSRHHCLLDINPPDVRVRDFGSLNGTSVNGRKIGQRERQQSAEEAAKVVFPEHDLRDGDEIELGGTVLKVGLFVPVLCEECQHEIPKEQQAACQQSSNIYRCLGCRQKAAAAPPRETPRRKQCVCSQCGRDIAGEPGGDRPGEVVCDDCKGNARQLIERLFGMAGRKEKKLPALEGYRVLQELGRGGNGAVYLASHEKTGERIAIKIMLPDVAVQERNKALFLREAQIARALAHPNLLPFRDLGCSDGVFFIVMEYCAGGSVGQLQRDRGGTLPIAEAVPVIIQALAGLEYAHQVSLSVKLADGSEGQANGIVHRDLKPDNFLLSGLSSPWVVKVGDYGLAKAFDLAGLSGHSLTGRAAGTLLFMPRQQLINFKYAQPEVDIWAMAASLYFLLTGAPPRDFPQGKVPELVVLETSAVPIRKRRSSVPKKLAEVIDLALIDQPAIQVKTARDFRLALEKAL